MSNTRDNERNTGKRDKSENSSNKPLPPTKILESQKPQEKKNLEKSKVKESKLLPTILPDDDIGKNSKKISKASKHVPSKERNVSKDREGRPGSSGFLPPSFPSEPKENHNNDKTGAGQGSKSFPKISLLEKVKKENIRAGDGFIKAEVSKQKEQAKAFQEIAKKIVSSDKPEKKPNKPSTVKTEKKKDDKLDIKVTSVKSKESIRLRAKSEPRNIAAVEKKNANQHCESVTKSSIIRESKTGSPIPATLIGTPCVDINRKNAEFPVQKQELHTQKSGTPSPTRKASGNNIATGENAIKSLQKSPPPKETSPVRSLHKPTPKNTVNNYDPNITSETDKIDALNTQASKSPYTKSLESMESVKVKTYDKEIKESEAGRKILPVETKNESPIKLKEAHNEFKEKPKEKTHTTTSPKSKNTTETRGSSAPNENLLQQDTHKDAVTSPKKEIENLNPTNNQRLEDGLVIGDTTVTDYANQIADARIPAIVPPETCNPTQTFAVRQSSPLSIQILNEVLPSPCHGSPKEKSPCRSRCRKKPESGDQTDNSPPYNESPCDAPQSSSPGRAKNSKEKESNCSVENAQPVSIRVVGSSQNGEEPKKKKKKKKKCNTLKPSKSKSTQSVPSRCRLPRNKRSKSQDSGRSKTRYPNCCTPRCEDETCPGNNYQEDNSSSLCPPSSRDGKGIFQRISSAVGEQLQCIACRYGRFRVPGGLGFYQPDSIRGWVGHGRVYNDASSSSSSCSSSDSTTECEKKKKEKKDRAKKDDDTLDTDDTGNVFDRDDQDQKKGHASSKKEENNEKKKVERLEKNETGRQRSCVAKSERSETIQLEIEAKDTVEQIDTGSHRKRGTETVTKLSIFKTSEVQDKRSTIKPAEVHERYKSNHIVQFGSQNDICEEARRSPVEEHKKNHIDKETSIQMEIINTIEEDVVGDNVSPQHSAEIPVRSLSRVSVKQSEMNERPTAISKIKRSQEKQRPPCSQYLTMRSSKEMEKVSSQNTSQPSSFTRSTVEDHKKRSIEKETSIQMEIINTLEEDVGDNVSPQHSAEIPVRVLARVSVKQSEVNERPTVEDAISKIKRSQEEQRSPCSQYLTMRSSKEMRSDGSRTIAPPLSSTRSAASKVNRQSAECNATSPPLAQMAANSIFQKSSCREQGSQQSFVRSKLDSDVKSKWSLCSKDNSSPEQCVSPEEQSKCAEMIKISHRCEKLDEIIFSKQNLSGGPSSRTYESPRRHSAYRENAKKNCPSSRSDPGNPQINNVSPSRYNHCKSQISSDQIQETYRNDRINRPPLSRQSIEIPSKRPLSMDYSSSPRKSSFLRSFEQKWKPVFEKYSPPCREYSSGSADMTRRSQNSKSNGVIENSRSKGDNFPMTTGSPRMWCNDLKHLESEMVYKYDNRLGPLSKRCGRSKQSTLDNGNSDSVLSKTPPERAIPSREEMIGLSSECDNDTTDTEYPEKSNVIYKRLSTNSENQDNISQCKQKSKQRYNERKKEEEDNSDSTIGCCEDDSGSSDSYESSDCETTISESENKYSCCGYTDSQDGGDSDPKQSKRKLTGKIVIRHPDILMKHRQVSIKNFNVKMECPEKMNDFRGAFPTRIQPSLRYNRTSNRRQRTDSDSDKGNLHQRSRTAVSEMRRHNNLQRPPMPSHLTDKNKCRALSLSPDRVSLSITDTLPYTKHNYIAMSNPQKRKASQTLKKVVGYGGQKVDCFQEVITPEQSTNVCKMDYERSVPGYFSDSDNYITSNTQSGSTLISSKDIEAPRNADKVQAQYDPVCPFHDYIFDEVMRDESKPQMPGRNTVYSQDSFVFDTDSDNISSTNSMALWFTRENDSSCMDNNHSSCGGINDYSQGQPSFNSYHETPTDMRVPLVSYDQNAGDSDDVYHLKQILDNPGDDIFPTDGMLLPVSTNVSQSLFDKFNRSSLTWPSNVANRDATILSHADSNEKLLKTQNNFDDALEKNTVKKHIGTKICLPETYEQSSHDNESGKMKCDDSLKHTSDDDIPACRAKAIQNDSSDMNRDTEDMCVKHSSENSIMQFEDMPPNEVDQVTNNYVETYCTSEFLDAFSKNKLSTTRHEKTRVNNQSNLNKNIVKSDYLPIRGNIDDGRVISPSCLPKANCDDIYGDDDDDDDDDDDEGDFDNNCGSEALEKRDNDESLEPYFVSHRLEDGNSLLNLNEELKHSEVSSGNSLPSVLSVNLCRGNGFDSKLLCDSESKQATQTRPCINEKEGDKSMTALSTDADVCTSLLKQRKCSSPPGVHNGWSNCSDKICQSSNVCDNLKGKQQGDDSLLKWVKGKLVKEIKKIGSTFLGLTMHKECNPIKKPALRGSSVDFTNTCFLDCTSPRCSTIHFASLDKDIRDTYYMVPLSEERRHKIYTCPYISKPYENRYRCSDKKHVFIRENKCNTKGGDETQGDETKHVAKSISPCHRFDVCDACLSQDDQEQPVLSGCVDCKMCCRKPIADGCSVKASASSDNCSLHEHPSSPVDGFLNDYNQGRPFEITHENRRPIQYKSSEEHDYDTNALVLISEYLDSKQKSNLRKKRRRKDATRLAIKKLSLFDPETSTFNIKTESSSCVSTNSQIGKQSYLTSNADAGQLAIKRSIASIWEPICFKSSFLKSESATTWKSKLLCSFSKMDDSVNAMDNMFMSLEARKPSRRVVKLNTSYKHSWVTPVENPVLLEAYGQGDCTSDLMRKDKQCINAPLSKSKISTTSCKDLESNHMTLRKGCEPSYCVKQTIDLDYDRECQETKCANSPPSKSMASMKCFKESNDMNCLTGYDSYFAKQTNGLYNDKECPKNYNTCEMSPGNNVSSTQGYKPRYFEKQTIGLNCDKESPKKYNTCEIYHGNDMSPTQGCEPFYSVKQTNGLNCDKESPKKYNTWKMYPGNYMPSKAMAQIIKEFNGVPQGYSQDRNQNANHGVNDSSPHESLSGISSESNADMAIDNVPLEDISPSNAFSRGGINRSKGVLDLPTMCKNYSEKKNELHSFYKRFKYKLKKEKDDEPFSEPVYQPSDMYRRDIQFAEFACKNVNSSGNIFDAFASENEVTKKNEDKNEGSEEDFHSAEEDNMIPSKNRESIGDYEGKGCPCCHIADVCNHRQFSIAEKCAKKRIKSLRHNCNCFLKHCSEDKNKWKTLQQYHALNHFEGLSNTTCEGICFSNNRSEQDEKQIMFPLYTALSGKRRNNLCIFQDNGPRNKNPATIKEFVNWYVIDDENDSRCAEAMDTHKPVSRNRSETDLEQKRSCQRENSHPVDADSISSDKIPILTSNDEKLPSCEENERDESDETEQSSSSDEEADKYSADRIAIEHIGYRLLAGCVHKRFNEGKIDSYYPAENKKNCYEEQQLRKCKRSTKRHTSNLRESKLMRGSREFFFPKNNDSCKYHIKGTCLRASDSKSLEDIEVPEVEKERVRFACDKDGDWAEVGRGSYGCVYLGLLDGEIEVAIKDFFESSSYDHIIHEARMLFYLQDTGITPNFYGLRRRFDVKKQPGEFCIIMEYFGDGKTLFNVLSDKTELTTNEWIDVIGQLVAGLRLIHKRNVLLNDLKADNILIDLYGDRKTIRYIDVGMATYKHGLAFQLPQNQMGKYNFLAPEVRGGVHTSKRSDIYSLGYMLDQILRVAGSALGGLEGLVSYCMDENPKTRPNVDEIVVNVHKFTESSLEMKSKYGKKRLPVQKTV